MAFCLPHSPTRARCCGSSSSEITACASASQSSLPTSRQPSVVLQNLRHTADIRRDHWNAACHRLHEPHAKGLAKRRIDQDIRVSIVFNHFIVRNVAGERNHAAVLSGNPREKAELVAALRSPQHEDFVDASIRQFCASARARFKECVDFDAKRQFLVGHVERVIYDRYKITLTGSVPVQSASGETKLQFRIDGEIDRKAVRSRPRTARSERWRVPGVEGPKSDPPRCGGEHKGDRRIEQILSE